MDVQVVGALIGAIAAIVAAIVSVLAKRLFSAKVGALEVSFDRDFKPTANLEKDSRLIEARELLQKQESSAKWNNRAAGSLVFGQYIVGGVLATSFVQQSLSTQAVGLLGVLVLISSLIHQTYRPDIQTRGARERAMLLRRLIRRTEDGLFAIRSDTEDAPTIHDVREIVSRGLSEIEEMELADTTATSERKSA